MYIKLTLNILLQAKETLSKHALTSIAATSASIHGNIYHQHTQYNDIQPSALLLPQNNTSS
jgi:hypothetical protein